MITFKNCLLVSAGLVILSLTLALTQTTSVTRAQERVEPTPVTVENADSRPVPIQGAVTIRGRVATCPDETCAAPVRNANDRHPYQRSADFEPVPGLCIQVASFLVPDGKRLVIEHVSAIGLRVPRTVSVTTQVESWPVTHWLTAVQQSGNFYATSQQVRLYADPIATVDVQWRWKPDGNNCGLFPGGNATISGYLVDL